MSINPKTDIYTDLNGLHNLKSSARKDARSALPEVARQFEAVMISMMIKGLRKTGMEDPYFKSQAMDSYRDMYDQQLAMELSKGQGIGLAESIVDQVQTQAGLVQNGQNGERTLIMPQRKFFMDPYHGLQKKDSADMSPPEQVEQKQSETVFQEAITGGQTNSHFESPRDFVQTLWPLAEKTARKLGVSAEIVLSQAALETGWGKHIIASDQQSSFNLFNIKAGRNWQGKRMDKLSMEYAYGRPIQQKSAFRAYDSFEQSFNDYADFILNSPRYKKALDMERSLHDVSINKSARNNRGFDDELNRTYIKSLHKAGYATDPEYSEKVMKILNSEYIQMQAQLKNKVAFN